MARISAVTAREVLDSRGWPTVEAEVHLEGGQCGLASVPSGASTGSSEALELRDGDRDRYRGRGVLTAVRNVRTTIADGLLGADPCDQAAIDERLCRLDGTPTKSALGANAVLAASLAVARAAAAARELPLWQHLNETLFPGIAPSCPLPMINILSGGHHAGFQLDIQDVLVIPIGARTTAEALEWTNAVYYAVRDILREEVGYTQLVADEGGFGPNLRSNEDGLRVVTDGIRRARLAPGEQVVIALDVASSHFWKHGAYRLAAEGFERDAAAMVAALEAWVATYPVLSIEDGVAEEDWAGWRLLTERLGDRVQLIGDDLFATNVARLRRGIAGQVANSVLVKVNQIGTLSEAAEACRTACEAGYTAVVSARSGETEDSFLADLAVASGAGQIKIGSIARSERLAKYNQMLRIEEVLGAARFNGRDVFARWRG
ncbi:MAG: phosphopyruvate hydratase [Fimbriimonadaceae bacterium]|nr:phosphopyruvate hydratase [Fimbriimonadaceae bacterium]